MTDTPSTGDEDVVRAALSSKSDPKAESVLATITELVEPGQGLPRPQRTRGKVTDGTALVSPAMTEAIDSKGVDAEVAPLPGGVTPLPAVPVMPTSPVAVSAVTERSHADLGRAEHVDADAGGADEPAQPRTPTDVDPTLQARRASAVAATVTAKSGTAETPGDDEPGADAGGTPAPSPDAMLPHVVAMPTTPIPPDAAGGLVAKAEAGGPAATSLATTARGAGKTAGLSGPATAGMDEPGTTTAQAAGATVPGHAGQSARTAAGTSASAVSKPGEKAEPDRVDATSSIRPDFASHLADLAAPAPSAAGPTLPQAAAGAPAGPPPGAPATPGVPLGHVPVEIGLRAMDGSSRFDIRLSPEDLGRIDVKLDIDKDGQVRAHLMVDRPETLAFLQRDGENLHRAFEQAGFKPAENGLAFSLRDPGGDAGGRGGSGEQNSSRPQPPAWTRQDADAKTPAPTTWQTLRAGRTGIDLHI